jgi:hypothetical protein
VTSLAGPIAGALVAVGLILAAPGPLISAVTLIGIGIIIFGTLIGIIAEGVQK